MLTTACHSCHKKKRKCSHVPTPMLKGRSWDDPRNNPRNNNKRKEIGLGPIRVGILDIEATSLNAGFGVVLCAVVQSYDPYELKVFRADDFTAWKEGRRADDGELVEAILTYLQDFDILVGHNALRYDMPFLRTRAVVHGFPPVNAQKLIDTCQLARRYFRFPGNSQQSISQVLGTAVSKTPLTPIVWSRAIGNGDQDAIDLIVEHCIADVGCLDEIIYRLRGYCKQIDTYGSFR